MSRHNVEARGSATAEAEWTRAATPEGSSPVDLEGSGDQEGHIVEPQQEANQQLSLTHRAQLTIGAMFLMKITET